jgi:hypothetical protein
MSRFLVFLQASFKLPSRLRSLLLAALSLIVLAAGPALAYEDKIYDFGVQGPDKWIVVQDAAVPGVFRYGWLSPAKGKTGACVNVFVQLLDKPHSARELLDANVKTIRNVAVPFKILRQEIIHVGSHEGFILEVVAPGTGLSVFPAKKPIPTHQRWYAVVRGQNVICVLTTSPDQDFAKYAPACQKVEKSLQVR